MNQITCKNCDSKTNGNYCHSCGQITSVDKVTFKETFQDFIDSIFSVNAPLLITLKLLVVNPGKLFKEFLSGKRKTYYKPVPFFILTTIVFILMRNLLNFDDLSHMVHVGVDSDKISSLSNLASKFMAENINNILFVFVFSFGLIIKFFFRKNYTLVEYFTVSFYIMGFYTLITTATTVIMFYFNFSSPRLKSIPIILVGLYVVYGITSLFGISFKTILKSLLAYVISFVLYAILGYGLSFFIVWLKSI